jgi:hypothetical protein
VDALAQESSADLSPLPGLAHDLRASNPPDRQDLCSELQIQHSGSWLDS